jgi:ribonuclease HI
MDPWISLVRQSSVCSSVDRCPMSPPSEDPCLPLNKRNYLKPKTIEIKLNIPEYYDLDQRFLTTQAIHVIGHPLPPRLVADMTSQFQDRQYPRLFSKHRAQFTDLAQPNDVLKPIIPDLLTLCSPIMIVGHPTVGLYIDGACPGNGTPSAKGGIGVYFGPDSPYNISEKLLEPNPTSQRAELLAAAAACRQILHVAMQKKGLELFIVVTDSAYLVDGLAKYVSKWKSNGWKTSKGHDVANRDLIEPLDKMLDDMSNTGIDVLFWKVDRSENVEADRLANMAVQ